MNPGPTLRTMHAHLPAVEAAGRPMTRRTVLAAALLPGACSTEPAPGPRGAQYALALPIAGQTQPLRLWLYLPADYAAARTPWPLVFFLHGSGERGDALDKVLAHGLPRFAARGEPYPFILCSPQLPAGLWNTATLHALRSALTQYLHVDPQGVSATGMSLGGYGVWAWAAAYPDDLAAIAPVCGYGDPSAVCRARNVPVRAYHGEDDPVVPLARHKACIDALRACGGTADLTVYRGVGHEAWIPAYQDRGLVPWLLARRLGVKPG